MNSTTKNIKNIQLCTKILKQIDMFLKNYDSRYGFDSQLGLKLESALAEYSKDNKTYYPINFFKPLLDACRHCIKHVDLSDEQQDKVINEHRNKVTRNFLQPVKNILEKVSREEKNIDFTYHKKWLDFHITRFNRQALETKVIDHYNDWLVSCYNTSDKEGAFFFRHNSLNRDDEMRSIVFNEKGIVNDFFLNDDCPGYYYNEKIMTWFLGRYDMISALIFFLTITPLSLFQKLFSNNRKNEKSISSITLWHYTQKWLFLSSVIVISFLIILSNTVAPDSLLNDIMILFYKFCFSLLPMCIILAPIFFSSVTNAARLLMPRLLCGVLIGYVPLLSSSESWQWLLQLPLGSSCVFILILLTSSFVLLFQQARNIITEDSFLPVPYGEILSRVTYVFFFGFFSSLFTGIYLCELFGETVIPTLQQCENNLAPIFFQGLLGSVYPKLVLLYAPLAFFIGLVVQLIWDEKSVTHPL